jgi:hypothetical protein
MSCTNITLTIQPGRSFITGDFVILSHDLDNYIVGQVVSYNATTGEIVVLPLDYESNLVGSVSGWTVSLSGTIGVDGNNGTSGTSGSSGISGGVFSGTTNYIVRFTSGTTIGDSSTCQQTNGDLLVNNNISVGMGGGSVTSNTRVGSNALSCNTTGTNNVAVGYNSLRTNTVGRRNVAVGSNALCANDVSGFLAGCDNIAIGSSTLRNNTYGRCNIAIGSNALYCNISG